MFNVSNSIILSEIDYDNFDFVKNSSLNSIVKMPEIVKSTVAEEEA